MYSPPLGASKSQLGGTYNLSLLLYTVNVFCDHIYFTGPSHRVMLLLVFFARPVRSTAKFATTVLIKGQTSV